MRLKASFAELYLVAGFGLYIIRYADSQDDLSPALQAQILVFLLNDPQCSSIGGAGPDGGASRFVTGLFECGGSQLCDFPSEVCTTDADFADFACTQLPPECIESINDELDLDLTTPRPRPTTPQPPPPPTRPPPPVTRPPGPGPRPLTMRPPRRTTERPIEPEDKGPRDWHRDCCFWAGKGECHTNKKFMCPICQLSCGTYRCTRENYHYFPVKVQTTCSVAPTVPSYGRPSYAGPYSPVPRQAEIGIEKEEAMGAP